MEKVLHFFQQFFKQCIQEFSAGVLSQIEDECTTVCRFAMVYAAKLKLQYLRYFERTFFCISEKLVLKDKMPIEQAIFLINMILGSSSILPIQFLNSLIS